MIVPLISECAGIAALVGFIIYKLTAKGTPWHVYLTVWVSWTMALSLVALVPVDLHIVYLKRCIDHYEAVNEVDKIPYHCPMAEWRTIGREDADEVLKLWEDTLKIMWLVVYTICQFNGWILLTFQSSYVESRHFYKTKRLQRAVIENGGLYGGGALLGAVCLFILVAMGWDMNYLVYGAMASANALCMVLLAILLGYGLAEGPRTLWQSARLRPSLRRALYLAYSNHKEYNNAAVDLARKMVAVYSLRRAASSSMRHHADKIMIMAAECPFEIADTFLMDPVRGPSIPTTPEEMQKAFLEKLHEIEMDRTHQQKMTEVDRWLTALEVEALLPRTANMIALQASFYRAKLVYLQHIDDLDPGVKGELHSPSEHRERADAIDRQLQLIEVPGSGAVRQALANAIMKRNDAVLRQQAESDDGAEDPMEAASRSMVDPQEWDVAKLVKLRQGIYSANRKYRKIKKKFDRAVRDAILLEDLACTLDELAPLQFMRAFLLSDAGDNGWAGFKCPVHRPFEGSWRLQWEVLWMAWTALLYPLFKMCLAVACAIGSVVVLWTQTSLFPGVGKMFGGASEGSLLLLSVCWKAAVPPNCIEDGDVDVSDWKLWRPYTVSPGVQVQLVIVLHLFYICSLGYFTLLRMKLFSLYEVVPGETDSFSLLFNAYVVCRVVPAVAHNYLAMVHEAHETESDEVTAFESVFSSMGRIPFLGSSFNEVLPPLMGCTFLLALSNALCQNCTCRLPRLDGEAHKTDAIIQEGVELVDVERRRYEKSSAISSTIRKRVADESEHEASGQRRFSNEGRLTLPTMLHGLVDKARGIVHGGIDSRPMLSDQDSQGAGTEMAEVAAAVAAEHDEGQDPASRPTWSKRIAQHKPERPVNGDDGAHAGVGMGGSNGVVARHVRHVSEPPGGFGRAKELQVEETRRGSGDEPRGNGVRANGQRHMMRQESMEKNAQQLLMDIENI